MYGYVILRKTHTGWIAVGPHWNDPTVIAQLAEFNAVDDAAPVGTMVDFFVDARQSFPAMAPPEPDPLDELLDAAGVGKDWGLPPVERRSYIDRTVDFEEAQKESRKKLADLMSDGKKHSESQLQWQADVRHTAGGRGGYVGGVVSTAGWWPQPSAPTFTYQTPTVDDVKAALDNWDPRSKPATDRESSLERKRKRDQQKARDNNRKGWKH